MVDGADNTVKDVEQQIQLFIKDTGQYAGTIVAIEDDVTDGIWAEFFADINEKRKERDAWFEKVKKPLNEALKELNAKQHAVCDPLKAIEEAITAARGNWLRVKQARVAEENKEAIQEAMVNGTGVAMVKASPTKTVVTSSGAAVGLRTQPSWRLTDDNTITAKRVEKEKMKFDRSDPRLKNVPDSAFILQVGMIMPLIKTGQMPSGPGSIEKFDDFASTSR